MANQSMALFAVYFLGNTFVTNLRNTGAFEVYVDDAVVWSKLASGRMPNWDEVLNGISSAVPDGGANIASM